jgi:hypothetical protein
LLIKGYNIVEISEDSRLQWFSRQALNNSRNVERIFKKIYIGRFYKFIPR